MVNLASENFEQEMEAIASRIITKLGEKHRSYGEENLTEFGRLGILIRSTDKFKRLKNMLYTRLVNGQSSEEVVAEDGESEYDAWLDLVGYGLHALRYIELERAAKVSKGLQKLGESIGPGIAAGLAPTPPEGWPQRIAIHGFDLTSGVEFGDDAERGRSLFASKDD